MNRRLSRALLSLWIGSAAALAAEPARPAILRWAFPQAGGEQTERFSRSLRIGKAGSLDLCNVSGNIVVRGIGGEEVQIQATKRAEYSDESRARRQLELVEIEVSQSGDRARVRTVYPREERRLRVSVDYTVSVPSGASVLLNSVSGNIRLSEVKGEARVQSVSGDLKLARLGGLTLAKSVSGNVYIESAESARDLEIASVSGDVTAGRLKAHDLDISSVSGNVSVPDASCERASVRSVSGDITYTGPISGSGRYEFKSHSGDLRLTFTNDQGFQLEARTFSGEIRSDVPIKIIEASESRRHARRSIRGVYGDGSAFISASSFSGEIIIIRK